MLIPPRPQGFGGFSLLKGGKDVLKNIKRL
jgi:hypothetical protein